METQGLKSRKERKGEGSQRPEPDSSPEWGAESEPEPQIASLDDLQGWLRDEAPNHLSAAQAGLHLFHQLLKSNGEFSRYVKRSLHEEPNLEVSRRWRNLLPLPLWPDVWKELFDVMEEGCYKKPPVGNQQGGSSKSKAARGLRLSGMLVWHGLVVLCLNFQAGGCRADGQLPKRAGIALAGQEKCLLGDGEKVCGSERS